MRYRRAERCLTGTLWQRGVGLDTGELELFAELLTLADLDVSSHRGAPHPERLRARYPEAVALTEFLTRPWSCQFLATTSIGSPPVIALIEASVAAIREGATSDLDEISRTFRAYGREATICTPRRARTRHAAIADAGRVRAYLRERLPRLRGTLLKHNDARNRPVG